MPSEDVPSDEDVRQTHNFAPGYYGLVYRANTGDRGFGSSAQPDESHDGTESSRGIEKASAEADLKAGEASYRLQSMKWGECRDTQYHRVWADCAQGLVPFWTKRNPDYGSMLKTINCRDDSLAAPGGMWNTMKQRKRCIVVAQGFYEWLKKDGGKTKIPHFIKRKDGQLMCMAGLWDCVRYEGTSRARYQTAKNAHVW